MIEHVPVMLDNVLDNLPEHINIVVDGTLGHGGHTVNILKRYPNIQKLFGFDLDPNILAETKKRLAKYSDKIIFVGKSYTEISSVLKEAGDIKADFVLLDLGVNMEHFKDGNRGFSVNIDAPLDMRFNNLSNSYTAHDIVNKYSEKELIRVFIDYAEFTEKKSQEIARHIIKSRKITPIKTTFDLKNILNQVGLGQKASIVIFQAIRIETNKEIDNLKKILEQIPDILAPGGRCGIITFHSIEDRVVKLFFKQLAKQDGFNLVSKKAIKPHYKEIEKNRASRSAKYRIIQKH